MCSEELVIYVLCTYMVNSTGITLLGTYPHIKQDCIAVIVAIVYDQQTVIYMNYISSITLMSCYGNSSMYIPGFT